MRSLENLFARRFLLSRKSHSVINIISRVSAVAVGIPVAAMVILMSVFNGFESLVRGMYRSFDPDVLVVPAEGKTFDVQQIDTAALRATGMVAAMSFVLEDAALLEYRGAQTTATVRGVDSCFTSVISMPEMMVRGEFRLLHGQMQQTVVGQGVAYNLGIRIGLLDPVRFYAPRRGHFSAIMPVGAYSVAEAAPKGVFALDADTDGQYVMTTIDFARDLFDYGGRASALMIALHPGVRPQRAVERIGAIVGSGFGALDRYRQKPSVYRIMVYEKWSIFFIAAMVLLIASFSVVGSLIMLLIDKSDDIRIMSAIGCTQSFIRRVFVRQGMMIACAGAAGGLLLGLAVCAVQQLFGVVQIPAQTFLVKSYPVEIRLTDLVCIVAVFAAINFVITHFTVIKTIPREDLKS